MFKVEYFVQRDGIGLPLFTELPRETVWKIAGGLIERGFWQYKRAK